MANGPPTPEELEALAVLLETEMRAQGVSGSIAYDRENQRLINEASSPISVAGFLAPYREAPEGREDEAARRWVAAHLRGRQPIETWEEARERLLPRLRPELETAILPLRHELEGIPIPEIVSAPLTAHVRLRFVWEIEDGTSAVLAEDLDRWGVTPHDLQAAALANLRKHSAEEPVWKTSKSAPGVYRSGWQDGFDATRVLFTGRMGLPDGGPLVAIATADDCLLVADSSDDDALFQLGLAAQRQAHKRQEMVWLWPMLLDGKQRQHWLPPENHSAYPPLTVCASIHAQWIYNRHGQLLQRVLEARDTPFRVSEVGMIQNIMGAAAPAVVWDAEQPAILAEADIVQFRRDGDVIGIAPFEQVQRIMGDKLKPMGGYPLRYRASFFPDDQELARLELG